MNARTPAPNARPRIPIKSQVRPPTTPPVASAPPTRPNMRPEYRTADDGEDEKEREQARKARNVLRRRAADRFRQGLSLDHAHHPIERRGDAAMEVAAAELGHDVLVDDPVGDGVRERTLEAITDFDPHLPVLQGDQEQRAVVDTLATQLPGLRHAEARIARLLPARWW